MNDSDQTEGFFSEGELIALAREDFAVFVELAFPVLHDAKPLVHADYIDVIIDALVHSAKGGDRRLIFNLPPGFMKSMLISVLYTAWLLGTTPSAKIICASYGDDLAHKLSRMVRKLMLSSLYHSIFPWTKLTKTSEDLLETTRGGHRYATAVGSDITGFRADVIIMDDPMQPDESANEQAKQKLRDWYDGVVSQRLLDANEGVIILVMHRLAPDDLAGTFVERGGWRQFAFPLIATEPVVYRDFKGRVLLHRERGHLLHPGRITKAVAEAIRAEKPPHIFDPQYQQNPRFHVSGICSVDRFVCYKEAPPFELLIHSWDLAATKHGGDWTVCAKFGLTRGERGRDTLCLSEIVRTRVELPDVRQLIIEHDRLNKPALIVLDANGIGQYIFQDLRKVFQHKLMPAGSLFKGKTNDLKIRRFHDTFPLMYDGIIRIPESMPNREILLGEFASFPDGKHDDQVDAICTIGSGMANVVRAARQNADRYGLWAPAEHTRRHAQSMPQRRPLKPHEQRFLLRRGLPLD
jgi:predicted phage terminase large subunit-like protein